MPELPEVETVCRGLGQLIGPNSSLQALKLQRGDLRQTIQQKDLETLVGQKCLGVRRRAKYILFDFEKHVLLNHLGMSGSWRPVASGEEKKHDHLYLDLSSGLRLGFNDPRRFGLLQVVKRGEESNCPALARLGPEPLDEEFSVEWIWSRTRKKQCAIKVWLMDQREVVGVGNIYASEALFRAKVRPTRQAGRITREEAKQIQKSVRDVLNLAIKSGGSTIRDFKQTEGHSGGFQTKLLVYGRSKENCRSCSAKITSRTLGGRSTYWCPKCQK